MIEVEKCESISKAAQPLYVNQPRLSKIIKEIEEEAILKSLKDIIKVLFLLQKEKNS